MASLGTTSPHHAHFHHKLTHYRPLSPHKIFSLSQPITVKQHHQDSQAPQADDGSKAEPLIYAPNSSPRVSFLYHTHSRVQHTWNSDFQGGWIRFDELWGEQQWKDPQDQLKWDLLWIGHEKRNSAARKRSTYSHRNKEFTKSEEESFHHVARVKAKNLNHIGSNVFGMVWSVELPFECEKTSILNANFKSGKGIAAPKAPLWLKMKCKKQRDEVFYLRLRPIGTKRQNSWLSGSTYAGEFHVASMNSPKEHLWKTHEQFQRNMYLEYVRLTQEMQQKHLKKPSKSIGSLNDQVQQPQANTILLQYLVDANKFSTAELEMLFFNEQAFKEAAISEHVSHLTIQSGTLDKCDQVIESSWSLDTVDDQRTQLSQQFDARFEDIFPVSEKMGSQQYMDMARYALSNMLGTVGFFHGKAKHATGPRNPDTGKRLSEVKGPFSLLSGVPCRSKFPRGFLWDEGFHQLLVRKWDPDLSKTILSYWFSLVDRSGWLPREQILGEEARSFVPPEFVDQHPHHANPPTLFFALEKFIDEALETETIVDVSVDAQMATKHDFPNITRQHEHFTFVESTYPNIQRHYKWFLRTQKGTKEGSYRWRGRETNHTLSSGLDDYPRGTFEPKDSERHLDLYCWVFMMTRTMHKYARFLGKNQDAEEYRNRMEDMINNFDRFHYSKELKWYADFVGGADDVRGGKQDENLLKDSMKNEEGYSTHLGYVSLFPIISQLVHPKHPLYKRGLKLIRSRQIGLWSSHGLRSLSQSDPLYGEAENYWRGPVWININYLVLRALHENVFNTDMVVNPLNLAATADEDSESNRDQLQQLTKYTQKVYDALRKNIIRTIHNGYLRKKTLFEQYDGETGHPKGTSPFTGWTSLVVQIMSESY